MVEATFQVLIIRRTLPLCLVFLAAGCVSQSTSGDVTNTYYSWWMPILVIVLGVVAVPIGLATRRAIPRLGWTLLIGGPLAVVLIAPQMLFERVSVDGAGVNVRSGIWGMTANLSVRFDGIRQIRIVEESTGGRRSRQIEVLYFDRDGGEPQRFALNNDVKIEGAKAILARANARGIPVLFNR